MARRRCATQDVLLAFPPLSLLPESFHAFLKRRSLTRLHFVAMTVLYTLFLAVAAVDGTLWIHGGIGVTQNEPFLAHLLAGALSIPLALMFIDRLCGLGGTTEEEELAEDVVSAIQSSRLRQLLFALFFSLGLFALSYTFVMSFSTTVDIYDSGIHPWTLASYVPIRLYLYLFAYPLVFSVALTSSFFLYHGLSNHPIPYVPFHPDGTGGLRRYLLVVDRPVYGVQSIAVVIALMNYLGWGGMKPVPAVLSLLVAGILTAFAVVVFIHFYRVVARKKRTEVERIHAYRVSIYEQIRDLAADDRGRITELVEELDSTERLLAILSRNRLRGVGKYVLNAGVLVAPKALELLLRAH